MLHVPSRGYASETPEKQQLALEQEANHERNHLAATNSAMKSEMSITVACHHPTGRGGGGERKLQLAHVLHSKRGVAWSSLSILQFPIRNRPDHLPSAGPSSLGWSSWCKILRDVRHVWEPSSNSSTRKQHRSTKWQGSALLAKLVKLVLQPVDNLPATCGHEDDCANTRGLA